MQQRLLHLQEVPADQHLAKGQNECPNEHMENQQLYTFMKQMFEWENDRDFQQLSILHMFLSLKQNAYITHRIHVWYIYLYIYPYHQHW